MNITKILLIVGCCACFVSALSQQVYTLPELYTLAEQNNKRISVAVAANEAAREGVAAARAARLPDISAQLSFSYNGRGTITDRNFSNATSVYIPEYGNNFALQVSQTIYAGGAITNGIKISELGQQIAELDVVKQRQEVRFLICGQYLDLYKSHNALEVINRNIVLTERMLQNMRTRYEQGTALKNDITRYELQLEDLLLQQERLKNGCKILNHNLCVSTGLPVDVVILPDTTLLSLPQTPQAEQYWQSLATEQNVSLQQADLNRRVAERQTSLARSEMLPKVRLFAEDYLNGPITIEIPAINKNFNYWMVGIGVQYKFSSLYKSNHNVQKAKLEQAKAQEAMELAHQQVETAIQAAHTDLRTRQKSAQLASENYQVVSNRYRNGLALITDLLDASTTKLQAELSLVDARINLLYNNYRLQYLCHNL